MNFFTDFSNPARDTYSWNSLQDNSLDKFANGSLAFFFGYSYHYDQIRARGPQINFKVLPMLQLNPDKQINSANYYLQSVLKKSKNKDIAWGILRYLTTVANKEYLDKSNRPTARRAFIKTQLESERLAPFASQVLVADNWYRGKNYESAKKALSDLTVGWLEVDNSASRDELKIKQGLLNNTASKINQTL